VEELYQQLVAGMCDKWYHQKESVGEHLVSKTHTAALEHTKSVDQGNMRKVTVIKNQLRTAIGIVKNWNISVVDLSPSDENSSPSTSHLQPTMEDITDVEDPIPSSSSFSSRPSSPCNPETDRVTPSSQDSITEPNDTFQIPPPLSPHRFISQYAIDANDPVSNPSSPAFVVLNTDPPSSMDNNDSQPGPPSDSHDKRSATSQTVDSDIEARVSFTGDTVVDSSVPAKTSEEIPFHPNPDVENVTDFVSIWSSKISSASDFGEFSNVCEALASAVVEKGKGMSNNTSGRRIPRPAPHRPNRRSPHPHRTRLKKQPNRSKTSPNPI
jgi:hypothetical protein